MSGPEFSRVGKAEGTPLVLLHGFGGTMRTWDKVVPLLEGEMPVIMFDLPGHGQSIFSDGQGGAGKMAKAILTRLNEEGIEAFHLGGHSMGGAVAALISMRAPEQVKTLTLVAPGGMAAGINAGLLELYSKAVERTDLRNVMAQMAGGGLDFPTGYFTAVSEIRSVPGAMEAIAATYEAMFPNGPSAGQGLLPRDKLEALPMPISMIWGDADAVLPCPKAVDVPANFKFTTIPGAGHMLPEEMADLVAQTLREAVASRS